MVVRVRKERNRNTTGKTKEECQFKKGMIANPNGRPKGTAVIPPGIKQFNSKMISEVMAKYISMDVAQLSEIIKDTSLPVLDMLVARILATGVQKADQTRFSFILDRMVGKVADKQEISQTTTSLTLEEYIKTLENKE